MTVWASVALSQALFWLAFLTPFAIEYRRRWWAPLQSATHRLGRWWG